MKSSTLETVLEILGVILVACSVMVCISLFTYSPLDPSVNSYLTHTQPVKNRAGVIGASLADTIAQTGGAAAWLFPLGMLYAGIVLCFRPKAAGLASFAGGLTAMALALAAALNLAWGAADPIFSNAAGGGALGKILAGISVKWFSVMGSWVIIITTAILSILVLTKMRFSAFTFRLLGAGIKVKETGAAGGGVAWELFEKIRRMADKARQGMEDWLFRLPEDVSTHHVGPRVEVFDEEALAAMAASEREESAANAPPLVDPLAANDPDNPPDEAPPLPPPPGLRKKKRMEEKPEAFVQEDLGFSGGADGYSYPSLGLLDSTPNTAPKQSKDEIIKRSLILEKKLLDFGIEGRVTQALPGPVITVYEFEPAPGVKVSRIASLADDLAMSLRAMSVRVLAPIPGKSVVGIEVPNPSREMVFLKELLASAEFEKSESKLTMLLGKDVGGTPMMVDLATVPHLLIAGSTGSGKSVGINAMICSILYKATPAEVKFIMIDPKMLELSIYEGIPHLITPVVTNPKKAANALRWAVAEMERRYERLSELGVRNIDGYNRYVDREKAKAANQGGEGAQQKAPPEKLPYIVVIIDELADLMMVASKDVEDALARLAQMARAAGVHLIVATQRPSVDVLTGLIKANFPARISYQVRTRVDSRTILDSMGADTLLGKGDMLLLPPGVTKLMRIHGPFVSDEEIHRVVDFLKQQQKPVYDTQILEAPAGTGEDAGADLPDADMDDNYDKAVELVAQTRQASISMIQRRLRIGYNRAARIVEMMEKQGLVGPADGLKPREVFIKELDDVESVN